MPRNKIPGQKYGDDVSSGEIATTRYGEQRQAEPASSTEDEQGHRRAASENAMFRVQEGMGIDSYEAEGKSQGMSRKSGKFQVRKKLSKPE